MLRSYMGTLLSVYIKTPPILLQTTIFLPMFIDRKMTSSVKAQCGNFIIFLSLRFYVKSNLETLEVKNLPFFAILEGSEF